MENNIVEGITQLAREGIKIEHDEKVFSPVKLYRVNKPREVETINLSTLSGLAMYLDNNIDNLDFKELMIVVSAYNKVKLVSNFDNDEGFRDLYVNVSLEEDRSFRFNNTQTPENLIIGLKSMFEYTYGQESLIQYCSKITVTDSIDTQDDGISQSTTVKKGQSGALKEKIAFDPIVSLKPYRTFREVSQPESQFLFRLENDGGAGKVPRCVLYEADGGTWKIAAVEAIKEYFESYKFMNSEISKELTIIS